MKTNMKPESARMGEIRLRGRPAAPGFARGPLVTLEARRHNRVASRDAGEERSALRTAFAAAAAQLTELRSRIAGSGTEILDFQLALLEDDALREPAFASIAAGATADEAWRTVLAAEIADYTSAADEHFRARAADLKDLRDRVLACLAGDEEAQPIAPGAVVAARDFAPSRFLSLDWSKGGAIILSGGSPSSHVAMLARARGVPMIVGLGVPALALSGEALVDGRIGEAVVDASPETRRLFESRREAEAASDAATAKFLDKPAVTRDGVRIAVHINVSDPDELDRLDPATCDGIGLVRTELLFYRSEGLPDEETQYAAYRRIVAWAQGKPVTIRTLDAGGDKPIAGLTHEGESNPFLGARGIRLSLLRPEIFRVQLRALARAAALGSVKIMLPMITVPGELDAARAFLEEEVAALAHAGIPARQPPLGIMVEVPAAAIAIEAFDADFFSIGSNDLTQYVTAAGRDIEAVADLADPLHPAILRLIANVAQHGRESRREVSLCGDAGGDPALVPALLGAGLRVLSVAPMALARAKSAIAALDLGQPSAARRERLRSQAETDG
jgi:phosphoenolpyruvate-protein phosphotransferase (PTS system enzyme I)